MYVQGACEAITCPQNRSHEVLWPATLGGQVATVPCSSSDSIALLRKCSDLGQWEAIQERPCFCSEDRDGALQWPRTLGGTLQSLHCPPAFTGSITRFCNRLGRWETPQRRCSRIMCPARSEFGVTFPRTDSGNILTVSCPFPFLGRLRRVCKQNGEWGYLFDDCQSPSCSEFLLTRDKHGCISVDVVDRAVGELIRVDLTPKPSTISSMFDATLPATICGLDANVAYDLYLTRFVNGTNWLVKYPSRQIRQICSVRPIYGKQQCENATIPLLRERTYDESGSGGMGIRVVLRVPFCYDLSVVSMQLRIECVDGCRDERPRILTHSCSNDRLCQTGNAISITSPATLSPNATYHITARAIPARSLLAIPSLWSAPLELAPVHPIVVQPRLQVIPKSSHVIRLKWDVDSPSRPLVFVNFYISVYLSAPHETTLDPRYLRFIDSQMLCPGSSVCERRSLAIPIASKDYRYVFILQSVPIDAQNVLAKNASIAYQVPRQPNVQSLVTNFDVFANISFSQSNMDVLVNCSVFNTHRRFMSSFSVAVDYGEVSWFVVNDLQPQSKYSVVCWVRDGFMEAREFDLSLQTVSFVPANTSMTIHRTTTSFVIVDLTANKHGRFHCMAMYTHDKEDLKQVSISFIEENGVTLDYLIPLHSEHLYIPLLHSDAILDDAAILDAALLDDDLTVYVICTYFPLVGKVPQIAQGKIMRLRGKSPTGPFLRFHSLAELYYPELLSRDPPAGATSVYSHSNFTLRFASPVSVKQSLRYFFFLEPILGLGPAYRPPLFPETPSTSETPGSLGSFIAYRPPPIRPEDCWIEPFSIRCPLPQLDSRTRYGLRASLPDMIADASSGHAIRPDQLLRGKYLLDFSSFASRFHGSTFSAGAPRISVQLLRPANSAATPLRDDLLLRFSRGDYTPTEIPLLLGRSFGGVVLRSRLGDDCSSLATEASGDLLLTIHVAKCLAALEPDTNYKLIIPAACWKHGSKESPSTVRLGLHTVGCRACGEGERQRASRRR